MCSQCLHRNTPGYHDCRGYRCEREVPNGYAICSQKCMDATIKYLQGEVDHRVKQLADFKAYKISPVSIGPT